MNRYYYKETISKFLNEESESIIGKLLINDAFQTSDLQKHAWEKEIIILKDQLKHYPNGDIILEYTIPRIGSRIDTVCFIEGVIFLLEFKVGEKEYKKEIDDQVMDYALDLKYFHEKSKDLLLIPISIATESETITNQLRIMKDGIADVFRCNKHSIERAIEQVLLHTNHNRIDIDEWVNSRYSPTPTIIEAAQTLYREHTVENIKNNDAENLNSTVKTIGTIIDKCKKENKKAICFITGVPGAGKTLAGLEIANSRHRFEEDEHAVFLSGNKPLVDVLKEALANDRAERTGITKKAAKRETKAFIQIVHKFRDEALTSNKPPIEKVVIFDEAQRAWSENELSNFMAVKKGVPDFHQSEPDFLINIMDRHEDWSVIVCLVGGGQEIYKGEAGIDAWFTALSNRYFNWDIYLSDKMTDSEYVGNNTIPELLAHRDYNVEPSLHLSVSLRSFRSGKLSSFVKALLDNDPDKAKQIFFELNKTYPIVLTRDFDVAKKWVRTKARGTERYGLLASSEGKRLRGEGIWVPTEINHIGWFLNGKDNVDSSYYLEVAASEFKVQGLEVDYAVVAWDCDLRREKKDFGYFRFRGTSWQHVNDELRKKYLKNTYRVLLTRARQGMVIYVPEGVDKETDVTRNHNIYDAIYEYLRSCGIPEINNVS